MTRQDDIAHIFAKYLLETDDGEFIAIENEELIDPDSEMVITTKPIFSANKTGEYHDLNCGVYVGELAGTPDTKDRIDIVIYKLQ